jgi:hypothetical protein
LKFLTALRGRQDFNDSEGDWFGPAGRKAKMFFFEKKPKTFVPKVLIM